MGPYGASGPDGVPRPGPSRPSKNGKAETNDCSSLLKRMVLSHVAGKLLVLPRYFGILGDSLGVLGV